MNIEFYNIKDKKPKHKQVIVYLKQNKFYSSYEFIFDTVEYSWDDNNGGQVCWHEGDSTPEPELYTDGSIHKYELCIQIGHNLFKIDTNDDFFWADCEEIEEKLENI
jgi:hypothetical protein